MATPDEVVVALLDAVPGLVAAPAAGANLFTGPVQPPAPTGGDPEVQQTPHEAVFCLATGGPAPELYSQGNTGPDTKRLTVQVRVRSGVGDFVGGQALARTCWTTLQRATSAAYMSIALRESQPTYLGADDTEHHHWSLNAELWVEE